MEGRIVQASGGALADGAKALAERVTRTHPSRLQVMTPLALLALVGITLVLVWSRLARAIAFGVLGAVGLAAIVTGLVEPASVTLGVGALWLGIAVTGLAFMRRPRPPAPAPLPKARVIDRRQEP